MNNSEAYFLGKQAALVDLLKVAEDGADYDQIYRLVCDTIEAPLEKTASEQDSMYWMGVESTCYSFLKEASQFYGEYDVEDVDAAMLDILDRVTDDFVEFEKAAQYTPFKASPETKKQFARALGRQHKVRGTVKAQSKELSRRAREMGSAFQKAHEKATKAKMRTIGS